MHKRSDAVVVICEEQGDLLSDLHDDDEHQDMAPLNQ